MALNNLMVPKDTGKRILKILNPDHVIYTLVQEHDIIMGTVSKLSVIREKIIVLDEKEMCNEIGMTVLSLAEKMKSALPHHIREEQALFPIMREYGISGPPDVMEAEHVAIQDYKDKLLETAKKVALIPFKAYQARVAFYAKSLNCMLRDHINKENNILFPSVLKAVKDEAVWQEMREKCDELGYCSFIPSRKLLDVK